MGNLGFGEVLLILIVLLLVFGTSRLPGLGDALGKGIRNFRRGARAEPGAPPPGDPTRAAEAADTGAKDSTRP